MKLKLSAPLGFPRFGEQTMRTTVTMEIMGVGLQAFKGED